MQVFAFSQIKQRDFRIRVTEDAQMVMQTNDFSLHLIPVLSLSGGKSYQGIQTFDYFQAKALLRLIPQDLQQVLNLDNRRLAEFWAFANQRLSELYAQEREDEKPERYRRDVLLSLSLYYSYLQTQMRFTALNERLAKS